MSKSSTGLGIPQKSVFNEFAIAGHFVPATKTKAVKAINKIIKLFPKIASTKKGKIGRTTSSFDRAKSYGKQYDYMYLIYTTSSKENANEMEDYLINKFPFLTGNVAKDNRGNNPTRPKYYVYLVF